MAQAIGTMYEVVNVPMRLYYSSDRANAKNTSQSGWVNEAGSYKIINHVVGTNNVDLYAINDITNSYAIGWIRDDDNIKGVRLYNIPSQISTNDSSYKVSLEGTKGIAYKYTAKIGTTVIHEESTTLTYPNTAKTFTLTSTIKNLIYKALGNNNTGVMNISAVSTHNGKTIRTSTSSISVVIPASNGPKFTTNPTVTIVGAIGGSAYKDISSVKVSALTSTISLKDNATIKSRRFQIGSHSTTTTADSYTSPVIGSVGSVPVRVTVTDSRNRSTTFETSVTFKEAQKISIDSFKAIRNGTTGIKITANGRYMSQIDGTPKYTITKSLRGKNTWSSVATGNVTVSSGRYSISVTQTSGFTATSAYDLRLVVSGTSTSATGNSVVGTEAVPISFGKHGSGVGTMFNNSNSASLQVGSGGINSEGPLRAPTFDAIDDRSLNPKPYASGSSNRGLSVHFKNSSTIGVPDTSTYSTLFDVQPWTDSSGGNHQQLAINSQGELYGRSGTSSWGAWRKFAFTSDIPSIPKPFTKGSNTNGKWIKFSDGTIIAERKVTVTYTHNNKIPNYAYNMPVSMPTDSYVGVSLRSVYTANSEAEIDIYDNFDFLVVGKRGNQWIMKPNLFNRYGSVSYGANNGKWFNTKAGTSYTMHLTFTAIGVV